METDLKDCLLNPHPVQGLPSHITISSAPPSHCSNKLARPQLSPILTGVGGLLGFSQHKNGRKSCQKVAESELKAHSIWERRSKYRQASFGQLCLQFIKKVSDSITQVWGLLTPNIWIFAQALKTSGCCTPHLGVCRHLSAALTWERGAPGQTSTSLEGPQPNSLWTGHTWGRGWKAEPVLSFSRLWAALRL